MIACKIGCKWSARKQSSINALIVPPVPTAKRMGSLLTEHTQLTEGL